MDTEFIRAGEDKDCVVWTKLDGDYWIWTRLFPIWGICHTFFHGKEATDASSDVIVGRSREIIGKRIYLFLCMFKNWCSKNTILWHGR